ncbi:MAG: DUF4339 domain-containing protein [Pirellulales bacterium]|nr:DUF4339 domain-containing protein [Pirellulales bacterium]
MASEWFCEISGEQVGPLSPGQLKAMAEQGQLTPKHRVKQGAHGPWVPAGRVKGLFPVAGQPGSSSQATYGAVAKPPSPRPVESLEPSAPEPPARIPKARPAVPKNLPTEMAPAVPPAPPVVDVTPVGDVPRGELPEPDSEFHITTDADTPWARVTGRNPAVAGSVGNQALVIGLLLVLLVALTAVGVWIAVRGPTLDRQAVVPDSRSNVSGDTPAGIQWIDASESAIQRGDVKISILSAGKGRPPMTAGLRGPGVSEECLLLRVELQNLGDTRKLDYQGWGTNGPLMRRIRLTDDLGNRYHAKNFGRAAVDGQVGPAPVYPDESIQDLLVFERPVDTAEYLHLELPAAAFGEPGSLCFEIPKRMIVAAEGHESPAPGVGDESPARQDGENVLPDDGDFDAFLPSP